MHRVLDPVELRRVFGAFPTGVTIVAAQVDGRPLGLTANSFTSVSLEPPMVLVCIAHSSTTWPALRGSPRLGVSVLAAHQEPLAWQFSHRVEDRFAKARWGTRVDGGVVLEGSSAWLDCSIEREIPAGDHDVVLLRVHDLDADPAVAPLVFHGSRYRRLHTGDT
jgi:flavin reductase (DIM6/NTAB) family NADH-FMN oxidoreductase RutF